VTASAIPSRDRARLVAPRCAIGHREGARIKGAARARRRLRQRGLSRTARGRRRISNTATRD
jgi:hypothetical protein